MAEGGGIAPEEQGGDEGAPGIWDRFRGKDPATGETDYWKRGGLAGVLGMDPWHRQSPAEIAMGFAGSTTPAVKTASNALKVGARELPIRRSPDDPFEYSDSYSNFARPGGNKVLPIAGLKPAGVSSHPAEQARVKSLIAQMSGPDGYVSRLLVDDAGHVIEGQHRFEALRQMGATDVPVTVIEDLGRNAPTGRMMEAAKAAGVPHQQLSQVVRQALEAIKDAGSASKAIAENEWPGKWQQIFESVIGAAGMKRIRKAEGGGIDSSGGDGILPLDWEDDVHGGDIRDQQAGRGGLAAFENAGDWGRAIASTPGFGPLGLAKDFATGTGWAGEFNPDYLTVDDMNAGRSHVSKATDIAEEGAGIAPPDYDDAANEENARDLMDALGGGEAPSTSGGGNAEARGGMEKEKRGGVVHRAKGGPLNPTLPPMAAAEPASGFLNSAVAGRTDQLHVAAPPGSYVIPADVVSGLGEGNSMAGARLLHDMFKSAPYGVQMPKGGGRPRNTIPDAPGMQQRARGGAAKKPVPILAAGGEFVVSDRDLAKLFGSAEAGHKALDHWVKLERAKIIKTMKSLPGPAKS